MRATRGASLGVTFPQSVTCYVCTTDFERGIFVDPPSRSRKPPQRAQHARHAPRSTLSRRGCSYTIHDERSVCRVGWVNRRCSISLRSFHARMETGCSGLHVLSRAPANSCKGVVDDYNVADIVVHCNLMRFVAKLRPVPELFNIETFTKWFIVPLYFSRNVLTELHFDLFQAGMQIFMLNIIVIY